MEDTLKIVLTSNGVLNVASLVFAAVFYKTNKSSAYKWNVVYWLCMCLTFIMQGILQEGHGPIVISYSLSSLFVVAIAYMLSAVFDVELKPKLYGLLLGVASLTSIVLAFSQPNFTLAAIPISFTIAGCLIHASATVYKLSKSYATPSAKLLLLVIGLGALHMADYPFLRLNVEAAIPAFSLAFLYALFMSVLIPYVIAENSQRDYLAKLESEVERKTHQLTNTVERLDEVAEERRELINLICHDIKNHQMVIRHYFDRIKDLGIEDFSRHRDFPKLTKQVENVLKLQRHLTVNVETMSSIEAGKAKLTIDSVNLLGAIRQSLAVVQHVYKKPVTLRVKCPESLNVVANEGFLCNSVLNNVISNAIKFSDNDGKIYVRAFDRGSTITLAILDHGIGIPQNILDVIFSKTDATTRSGTSGERGTGFGMPLALSILDKFGARIGIKSRCRDTYASTSMTLVCIEFKKAGVQVQIDDTAA